MSPPVTEQNIRAIKCLMGKDGSTEGEYLRTLRLHPVNVTLNFSLIIQILVKPDFSLHRHTTGRLANKTFYTFI